MRTVMPYTSQRFAGGDAWWWVRMLFTRTGVSTILFLFLVGAATFHFSRLMTERVRGELLLPPEDIVSLVQKAREGVKAPTADDAIVYFETVDLMGRAEGQCQLFERTIKGAPIILVGSLAHVFRVCRELTGDLFLYRNDMLGQYYQRYTPQVLDEARERYSDQHPGWAGDGSSRLIETEWHMEELLFLYTEGMLVSLVVFLLRLQARRFNVWLEIVMGRLVVSVILWPMTLFVYRGDPKQQLRDLCRVITFMATSAFSVICPVAVKAAGPTKKAEGERETATLEYSAGVNLQTSYVVNNGSVLTPGPVVQPWVEMRSVQTGWYASLWSSLGLQTSAGQEVDLTVGRRMTIEGVSLDWSYNYYRFTALHEGMHAPQLIACNQTGLCGKIQLLVPDTGAKPGSQVGIWWTRAWIYGIMTDIGLHHTRDVYESKPVTVLKGNVSVPFGEGRARWFVTVFGKLFDGDAGNQEPKIVTGIQYAF